MPLSPDTASSAREIANALISDPELARAVSILVAKQGAAGCRNPESFAMRWMIEEACEFGRASSAPEALDAALDSLGALLLVLAAFPARDLRRAFDSYNEAQRVRGHKPLITYRVLATVAGMIANLPAHGEGSIPTPSEPWLTDADMAALARE